MTIHSASRQRARQVIQGRPVFADRLALLAVIGLVCLAALAGCTWPWQQTQAPAPKPKAAEQWMIVGQWTDTSSVMAGHQTPIFTVPAHSAWRMVWSTTPVPTPKHIGGSIHVDLYRAGPLGADGWPTSSTLIRTVWGVEGEHSGVTTGTENDGTFFFVVSDAFMHYSITLAVLK